MKKKKRVYKNVDIDTFMYRRFNFISYKYVKKIRGEGCGMGQPHSPIHPLFF